MKRIFAFVLMMAMLLSLAMPVSAQAEKIVEAKVIHRVNPLYENLRIRPLTNARLVAAEPSTYYTNVSDAAAALRAGLKNRQSTITIGYKSYGSADVRDQVFDLAVAHTGVSTEGDYLLWHYYSTSMGLSGYQNSGYYYYTLTYNMTYLSTAYQEQQMNTAVSNLLSQLDLAGKTDYQKVCSIYDYICDNITYDYYSLQTGNTKCYTAYAALIDKTAVCQGYATLFYRLALEVGVDARVISGVGNGGPHGWNIVKLDGKYYNLDSTWDAGNSWYEWFLLSDGYFYDHTRDAEYKTAAFYNQYPMSTSNYSNSYCETYGHSFDSWTVIQPAACTEPGVRQRTCSKCGTTETSYFDGPGHKYKQTVYPPTCTTEGYTKHYCVCNDVYQTDFVPAIGHSFGDWQIVQESTCSQPGSRQRLCATCGTWETEQLPAPDHSKTVVSTTPPTCATQGYTTYFCSICGSAYNSDFVPTVSHSFTVYVSDYNATTEVDGTKTAKCDYCDATDTVVDSGSRLPEQTTKIGWVKEGSKWYYYRNGNRIFGWLQEGSTWYYLWIDGAMVTGWVDVGGTWYYMKPSGAMATGWIKDGSSWYYLKPSGAMARGWLQEGSTWYYLKYSGEMVTGIYTIDNQQHQFNGSGVWLGQVPQLAQQNGWVQNGGSWYYYKNGTILTGWQYIGNVWYYLKVDGKMATGWVLYGGDWYYLQASGAMTTTSVVYGGKTYYFNASGVCLNP